MAPFEQSPLPKSPFDLGDEPRGRELLGDAFGPGLEKDKSTLRIEPGAAYSGAFSSSCGPTETPAEALEDRRRELPRTGVDFFENEYRVDGEIAHAREYVLVLGRRR